MQISEPSGLLAQIPCLTSCFLLDFVMDTDVFHPLLTFKTEIHISPLLEVLATEGLRLSLSYELSG